MKWISASVTWCFAFGGYLLFTGTVSGHELATAAGLATGATRGRWRSSAVRRAALHSRPLTHSPG